MRNRLGLASYLAFRILKSASDFLRSTNLPESINNQIENLRRNAGGHSQREALIKMKLLTNQLYEYRWTRVNPKLLGQIGTLNELFRKRFEVELNPETFLTQILDNDPQKISFVDFQQLTTLVYASGRFAAVLSCPVLSRKFAQVLVTQVLSAKRF